MPILFGVVILLSALLLFSIQPLVAKILLPLLGGAPAVWNTVMLFFQGMLLAGYAWAHYSVHRLGLKRQCLVQFLILMVAAFQVPFSITPGRNEELQNWPIFWVLLLLAKNVGLPVFALAATAPLIQQWFAATRHIRASDPYFLYAASNVGSFAALFAYPFLIEPWLRLATQIQGWSILFWIYGVGLLVCGLFSTWRVDPIRQPTSKKKPESLPRRTLLKWIGLAFVPSSLLLGVTSYITSDVASVPLLWIVPLALYLATFVIAFSRHSQKAEETSSRTVPIFALAVIFTMVVQATEPVWVLVALHLIFFLFAALQLHLRLAISRPATEHLTSFYLCMSIGGFLGGVFNGLLAPVLFRGVVEYPLMIIVATLMGFPLRRSHKPKYFLPPVYGGAVILLLMTLAGGLITMAYSQGVLIANLLAAIILFLVYIFIRGPVRFTLALGSFLLATVIFRQATSGVIERERNFFGVLKVASDPSHSLRRLYHGTTIHGIQSTATGRKCEPLSYYHRAGPVSDIAELYHRLELPPRVGLVGLGAGAMLAYSRPEEHWSIYEIDPAVIRIAQDTSYFTYLSECAAASYQIKLGDARLRLQNEPDHHFGLLYIDAFSSDVVPMHLLTVEAVRLYRQKLAAGGVMGFHLSSRHFELQGLVARLGAEVGLQCFESLSGDLNPEALAEGGLESTWVILVEPGMSPRSIPSAIWKRVDPSDKAPLWTDDFSSLVGVLRF